MVMADARANICITFISLYSHHFEPMRAATFILTPQPLIIVALTIIAKQCKHFIFYTIDDFTANGQYLLMVLTTKAAA